MKKGFILTLLFIFLIYEVSAAEITFTKSSYLPQETLQATISGVYSLRSENIFFYSAGKEISMNFGLGKVNDLYYLYVLLPREEKNVSLVLKNVQYSENNTLRTGDLSKDFIIKASNGNLLSLNPGFIITKEDFSILFQNKGSKKINFNLLFNKEQQSISLDSQGLTRLMFSVKNFTNFTLTDIVISGDVSYKIPVAIIATSPSNDSYVVTEPSRLFFKPYEISLNLNEGDWPLLINITNQGTNNVDNVTFAYSNSIKSIAKIIPSTVSIPANKDVEVNLIVNATEGIYNGVIDAIYGNFSSSLYLSINVNESLAVNLSGLNTGKRCAEVNGLKCEAGETCDYNNVTILSDGPCCLSKCTKHTTSYLWLGILLILVAVGGIGAFLFFRLKKSRKPAEEIIKERGKEFEERMKGTEVRQSLTKT